MKKQVKRWLIFILWIAAVIFLALAAYTNLIFDDTRKEVPVIAVALDDDADPRYDSMKKGMSYAANEEGVKIYYDNLKDDTRKARTEMNDELIQRSMLIVRCDARNSFTKAAAGVDQAKRQVIFINPDSSLGKNYSVICCDEEKRGEQLGKKIVGQAGKSCHIYACGKRTEQTQRRLDGLKKAGLSVSECIGDDELKGASDAIWQVTNDKHSGEAAAVGLDLGATDALLTAANNGGDVKLYGFDVDHTILTAMENGKLEGMNVISEYELGYQAMRAAMELEKTGKRSRETLSSYTIMRTEMFEPKYTDILFPE